MKHLKWYLFFTCSVNCVLIHGLFFEIVAVLGQMLALGIPVLQYLMPNMWMCVCVHTLLFASHNAMCVDAHSDSLYHLDVMNAVTQAITTIFTRAHISAVFHVAVFYSCEYWDRLRQILAVYGDYKVLCVLLASCA